MCGISSGTSDGAIKNIYRWVVMLLQAMWLICPNSCHPLHWDHHLLPFIQTLEPRHSLDDICRWAWSHTGLHISLYTGFQQRWFLRVRCTVGHFWWMSIKHIFFLCLHNLVVFDYWLLSILFGLRSLCRSWADGMFTPLLQSIQDMQEGNKLGESWAFKHQKLTDIEWAPF